MTLDRASEQEWRHTRRGCELVGRMQKRKMGKSKGSVSIFGNWAVYLSLQVGYGLNLEIDVVQLLPNDLV